MAGNFGSNARFHINRHAFLDIDCNLGIYTVINVLVPHKGINSDNLGMHDLTEASFAILQNVQLTFSTTQLLFTVGL